MRLRFWGTRGSIPKPGPATLRYGGNTSCVELRTSAGTRIIIDCGSGAQDLGHVLMSAAEKPVSGHILISHTHWDHIQGLPFFTPLFVPGNEWDIYGPHAFCHSLRDALAGQMQYTYFPVALQHLGATTRYHDLVEGAFDLAEVSIRTRYLNHPALTLAYRIEVDGVVLVYACDHEPHSRQLALGSGEISERDRGHADFLAGADLVIHDAQYTAEEYPAKVGWGHSTIEYAVAVCRFAGVKRLAIAHHDPLRTDDQLDRIIQTVRADLGSDSLEVFAAAEGQELELEADRTRAVPEWLRRGPPAPPSPSALRDQVLLLVATDPDLVRSVTQAVQPDDVRVLHAGDGASAGQMLEGEGASLVLLEHRPPEIDALDVCRRIRSLDSRSEDIPVVLIGSEQDAAAGAGDEGVTEWLIRPFSEVYLRTKLHAWLMRTACRWVRAPRQQDEKRRLALLQEFNLLDSPPEDRFDRITRLAAALFDVPMALVTLIDRDRQWFKARHGLAAEETSLEVAFCAHAILGEGVMMVPDALADDRFADNPFVAGEPGIRFYAGHPLVLDDEVRIGTLCLVDTRPRCLDESKLALLRDLGHLVEQELRASRKAQVTAATA